MHADIMFFGIMSAYGFADRVDEMERLARLVRERKGGFAAI